LANGRGGFYRKNLGKEGGETGVKKELFAQKKKNCDNRHSERGKRNLLKGSRRPSMHRVGKGGGGEKG